MKVPAPSLDYATHALRENEVDLTELEAALSGEVSGEVRFDPGTRGMYSTGAANYRQVPLGVVLPRNVDDVIAAVATCRRFGAPLLGRGGGTSLAGQTSNVAVILDFSKYMCEVIDVDPGKSLARVQPGAYLDRLNDQAAKHGLVFAPDPATHSHCTLGGMIGNNSCGIHSVMAGRTSDNVEELEILTYDGERLTVGATTDPDFDAIVREGGRRGEIYARLRDLRDKYADAIRERFPEMPRRVSGYNLDELLPEHGSNIARALVGTEGTCAITLEATLNLVHSPPARSLVVLGYPDVYRAADHVVEVMEHHPIGLEGIDDALVEDMRKKSLHVTGLDYLPEGKGWLLAEFGGETEDEATAAAESLMKDLSKQSPAPDMRFYEDSHDAERIWEIRESGLGATAFIPGEDPTWEGWEDSAVPPESFADYLRDLRALFEDYDYKGSFYGHFGQGCLHTRINFDLRSAAGIKKYRAFVEEASDLVVRYGGSFSGEHGDGQSRAELLPKMFGDQIVEGFREFKSIWDPAGMMNPGKVVDPYRITDNLRLGTGFSPWTPETHFSFPQEGGNFTDAALRCVGVGKCRREEGGVMCPSYMATREEKHSTRGRARLLFEMLAGDPVDKGWRDPHVHEALDLCLACKGCKSDCPVNVDMATYKAEFYSHHYKRRLRPRQAYALGLIYWWARAASKMPRVANFLTHARGIGRLFKKVAGVAPERTAPEFAPQTFRAWFAARPKRSTNGPRVILWPDTFNNHFHPGVAKAAVEVLERAGYRVDIPPRPLCCGRPLYDYGMLTTAKRMLRQTLDSMSEDIRAGVPLVGLEPSCTAVFRDELTNLLPNDEDAKRLADQFFTLAELLRRSEWKPPRLDRRIVVHGHCHHRSVMGIDADRELLEEMGADVDVLDAGCCGLAGSFGFEAGDKYDVSIKCAERELLPSVRDAAPSSLIVTDGFSCKSQIAELSDRRALHLAQVLKMAADEGPEGPEGRPPEIGYPDG